MIKLTTAALFFLAAGIFTSVTILSAFQILFGISVAYYTYIAIKEKKFQLPMSAWFMLAFALVAAISLFINAEHVPKFMKNFGRVKYYLYGVLGIFVFRAWINEASDKVKKIVANTFFVSLIVCGLYTFYEFLILGRDRAWGLTETMRYGYGSGMALLCVLGAILHRKKLSWLDLRFAIPAFILGFIGMYLTYTRGALLGFLCGLPFVLYFYKKKLGIALGSIAVIVVLTLGSFYFFGSGQYESRFLANKNVYSDKLRRAQWTAGLIAFQERPLLGWGYDNFSSQVGRIKLEHHLFREEYRSHSHNQFIEIASGTGLIGIILFLGWLFLWALECFRANELVKGLTIPFGVAFIVSSQFEATLNANISSMLFAVYAISASLISERRS